MVTRSVFRRIIGRVRNTADGPIEHSDTINRDEAEVLSEDEPADQRWKFAKNFTKYRWVSRMARCNDHIALPSAILSTRSRTTVDAMNAKTTMTTMKVNEDYSVTIFLQDLSGLVHRSKKYGKSFTSSPSCPPNVVVWLQRDESDSNNWQKDLSCSPLTQEFIDDGAEVLEVWSCTWPNDTKLMTSIDFSSKQGRTVSIGVGLNIPGEDTIQNLGVATVYIPVSKVFHRWNISTSVVPTKQKYRLLGGKITKSKNCDYTVSPSTVLNMKLRVTNKDGTEHPDDVDISCCSDTQMMSGSSLNSVEDKQATAIIPDKSPAYDGEHGVTNEVTIGVPLMEIDVPHEIPHVMSDCTDNRGNLYISACPVAAEGRDRDQETSESVMSTKNEVSAAVTHEITTLVEENSTSDDHLLMRKVKDTELKAEPDDLLSSKTQVDATVIDEIKLIVEDLDMSPHIDDFLTRYVGWEVELLKNLRKVKDTQLKAETEEVWSSKIEVDATVMDEIKTFVEELIVVHTVDDVPFSLSWGDEKHRESEVRHNLQHFNVEEVTINIMDEEISMLDWQEYHRKRSRQWIRFREDHSMIDEDSVTLNSYGSNAGCTNRCRSGLLDVMTCGILCGDGDDLTYISDESDSGSVSLLGVEFEERQF